MTLLNSPFVIACLLPISMLGCRGLTSFAGPSRIPNETILSKPAFSQAIESYTDEFLTEIIRINNFNRDRVSVVFCIPHIVYVDNISGTDTTEAYVKLLCAEGSNLSPNAQTISNYTGLESKLTIQQYPNQDRFKVIGQETPRDTPFLAEDHKKIFRPDILDRLNRATFDTNTDYAAIRQKAEQYCTIAKDRCHQAKPKQI
jgi:hypothetical protein